jgi:short-subunit dehydrogenase
MEALNAVVTGGSRGIGPYIADALAKRGMNLLLVSRTATDLDNVASNLRLAHPEVHVATLAADLGDPGTAERVFSAAEQELGHVDILVNNAAVEPQTRFHVLTPDEISYVLQVDLSTPILLSRLVLPGMVDRGYGRIVNISSMAGHVSFPFTEAYAAAKDGLTAFSRVLHSDYRRSGVWATSLILGAIKDTGLGARTMDEVGLKASTAFASRPEKVAAAVLKAVDKRKIEMVVSPGPGRFMKAMLDYFPGIGPALNRASGAEKVLTQVADYREARRPSTVEGNGRLSA